MQFNELRKQLNKQNEYFTKEIESLMKNQTESLDQKNPIKEFSNELASIGNTANQMKERIRDTEIEI